MQIKKVSEKELISLCISGVELAKTELYNRYYNKLYSICYQYSRNKMTAEDILHEGFIRIFKYLPNFKFNGSFEGWMRRTMVNTALNYYRKNLVKNHNESEFIDAYHHIRYQGADAISKMAYDELVSLVEELPKGYRNIFKKYYFENFKHQEVADFYGVSINTSKTQYFKARRLLKEKIEKRGYLNR